MLKMLILPLIVSSMISAIGSLDLSLSGRIGFRAIVYYMSTTVSAVILGIILVLTIHPGEGSETGIVRTGEVRHVTTPDMLMDLVRYPFPFIFFLLSGILGDTLKRNNFFIACSVWRITVSFQIDLRLNSPYFHTE